MNRGNWFSTEQLARFCLTSCHIVFPRFVGTILGAEFCCARNVDVKNGWYELMGPGRCSCNVAIRDDGMVPIHNEVSGNTGKYIRYHVVKQQDYGKTITMYGKQYGAQPLQELDTDNNWKMGLTLAAQNPIAQTSVLVTKIDSITREATQGMAYLYEYDPATTQLRDLAVFEPSETNPRRRRMKVMNMGLPSYTDTYGRKIWNLTVMFHLEFIPVAAVNDFLLISNFAALKLGIKALKLEEADDMAGAEVNWTSAIRELNMEDRTRNPTNSFVVKNFTLGSDRVLRNPT